MFQSKALSEGVLSKLIIACALLLTPWVATSAQAAGTLTPHGSGKNPMQIRDHHLEVTVDNGFAKTEVTQTFYNPNREDLEAIYSFPVPKSASLSEFTIYAGEIEINGEVLTKDKAEKIYQEEKSKGNDAGLAKKNSYKTFEFQVAKVPAQAETRIRFVYYQPVKIDHGIGRYVYPLEDGGTDDQARGFWSSNSKVVGTFSAQFDLRIAYPIADIRLPGFEAAAKTERIDEGHVRVSLAQAGTALNRDLVLYYRLAEDLPARLDLISYRREASKPGTFMLTMTPGVDLQPLSAGSDYVFVLDYSGSMEGKYRTLVEGVDRAIGELKPQDRFRIVLFNNLAWEIDGGWQQATEQNVQRAMNKLLSQRPNNGTNLYAGMEEGLRKIDESRTTSVILVTDAVANRGIIAPAEFHKLMKGHDLRVFGFLLGNGGNWPLMKVIADSSGGFYAGVSNADDIIGQIMLAKSKVSHQALHHAELSINGVRTYDATDTVIGKVYRGEQLTILGRYSKGGKAEVVLKARISGEDKVYRTVVEFPEQDTAYPELERIWALERIEKIQQEESLGMTKPREAKQAIEDIGVQYQLVSDHTSMVVLSDEVFAQHNIERKNQVRVQRERRSQVQRRTAPRRPTRADQQQPMYGNRRAPRPGGGGGGALDPISGTVLLAFGAAAISRKRKPSMDLE